MLGGLFPNNYRLLRYASNAVHDFVTLGLSNSRVATKQHQLRHETDLFLANPIYLFFVPVFTLELSKTLAHDYLVFLGK